MKRPQYYKANKKEIDRVYSIRHMDWNPGH